MLQKFKITTCAFILCLFGLTLMTVTPVLAMDSEFAGCDNIGSGEVTQQILKKMLRCFKQLALDSDGKKGEAYMKCQSIEKGQTERKHIFTADDGRQLECFRALVSSMGLHQNPERQPQTQEQTDDAPGSTTSSNGIHQYPDGQPQTQEQYEAVQDHVADHAAGRRSYPRVRQPHSPEEWDEFRACMSRNEIRRTERCSLGQPPERLCADGWTEAREGGCEGSNTYLP